MTKETDRQAARRKTIHDALTEAIARREAAKDEDEEPLAYVTEGRVYFREIDTSSYKFDPYPNDFTVSFYDDNGNTLAHLLGPKNMRTQIIMEHEYLARLHALQNELAAKYAPLFDLSEELTLDNFDCEGFRQEACKLFPR